MTAFVERGAVLGPDRPPIPEKLALRSAEMITDIYGPTVHHTGAFGTLYHVNPYTRLQGIYDYHVKQLGYGDIAYESALDGDGRIFFLRDNKYIGAHALGTKRGGSIPNQYTNGLVYLEDARGWTPAAQVALHAVHDLFVLAHHREPKWFAHNYWSFTECPATYLNVVVKSLGGFVG